ncbi:cytochrome b [Noviherbaspirillum cavernae]|uniref:Cytochrome b n=2 Tax=Noviherbaspirillum cavernae TaxID=2320862 RepID=A0A418X6U6_9BURK|nr:cytochrome b [Noviherbaspirillum cavernae]
MHARHSLPTVVLHWTIAALIIGLLVLGYYMVGIPRNTPERAFYFNLHKSLGVLVAVLILARIVWRFYDTEPPLPGSMPKWEVHAAQWGHHALYLCMVLVPLTGYISSSFNKYGVKFFGIALPSWGWEDKPLRDLFAGMHYILAWAFAALILIHVLAALKHVLLNRDRIFQRMLPRL